MVARDVILAAVRANLPSGVHDLPELPTFPLQGADDRATAFARNLKQMGGQVLRRIADADLRGVVCSAVPEIPGTRDLTQVVQPADLADVNIAVVRAACGIAETGSVLFTEDQLRVNALAYLAQHLLVLLDPADIVASTQDAYGRPEFRQASYAVFHTGPSATADIEGVLVHGAQGVRSLTVVLSPRSALQEGKTTMPNDDNRPQPPQPESGNHLPARPAT